ncbi:MAG: poly(R)-hydroxyalkanoic acid synthase subunit PhaE [Spiribacter sp.]|jgi:Poly(R)-hydroxyalkanoic acid synthase subunit (PHA_synth_III_E).|nr:poly(R)-hydroxyalkanoic acid synthase subunit PhaE [Spiribacter sp.]MDR9489187.1 poly(R)-hydroxyalkanoic acid synthase subunit PhaE [Spiribacter sp.]
MSDDSANDQHNWADWLEWLNTSADPLAVSRLLEQSAQALEEAGTPEQAIERLAAAIQAESKRRHDQGEALGTLLEQWAQTLLSIAPMLPNTEAAYRAWTQQPALGPFPRRQALLKALPDQIKAYQNALGQQLESATRLAEACMEAFHNRLQQVHPDTEPTAIASEALLKHWNAVAEPAYEHWLDQPDTQSRIAALTNAWSDLLGTLRALSNELLEGLGLPSPRALDDLAKELQRQRRRHKSDVASLRAEILALHERLDGQRS